MEPPAFSLSLLSPPGWEIGTCFSAVSVFLTTSFLSSCVEEVMLPLQLAAVLLFFSTSPFTFVYEIYAIILGIVKRNFGPTHKIKTQIPNLNQYSNLLAQALMPKRYYVARNKRYTH
jgi:hypothetical protein